MLMGVGAGSLVAIMSDIAANFHKASPVFMVGPTCLLISPFALVNVLVLHATYFRHTHTRARARTHTHIHIHTHTFVVPRSRVMYQKYWR